MPDRNTFTRLQFLPAARQLRDVFDERFAEPRSNAPERFLWDYWHVPDQYTLIRTQAKVGQRQMRWAANVGVGSKCRCGQVP